MDDARRGDERRRGVRLHGRSSARAPNGMTTRNDTYRLYRIEAERLAVTTIPNAHLEELSGLSDELYKRS